MPREPLTRSEFWRFSSEARADFANLADFARFAVTSVDSYAVRVWLDPDKLAARQLTTRDVTAALERQNVQVAAGQPAPASISPVSQAGEAGAVN